MPEKLRTRDDIEAIVSDHSVDHKLELRVWLRLLACANIITAEIRRNLRKSFAVTLPQFDLLAQLQREQDGLRLGELSRRLMVTNGNVTGLVDKLADGGFVVRETVPGDLRVQVVRMTKAGASLFAVMAEAHERWLARLMQDMPGDAMESLLGDLSRLKTSMRRNEFSRPPLRESPSAEAGLANGNSQAGVTGPGPE
ncbi:MAG: MarR family transcriptional regulator [Hyphomicrobiales bacterium]|nr:MarR family transcriptional regulator [Hyphomicrobiales bacterium]